LYACLSSWYLVMREMEPVEGYITKALASYRRLGDDGQVAKCLDLYVNLLEFQENYEELFVYAKEVRVFVTSFVVCVLNLLSFPLTAKLNPKLGAVSAQN
jgi:hypothetical protein